MKPDKPFPNLLKRVFLSTFKKSKEIERYTGSVHNILSLSETEQNLENLISPLSSYHMDRAFRQRCTPDLINNNINLILRMSNRCLGDVRLHTVIFVAVLVYDEIASEIYREKVPVLIVFALISLKSPSSLSTSFTLSNCRFERWLFSLRSHSNLHKTRIEECHARIERGRKGLSSSNCIFNQIDSSIFLTILQNEISLFLCL